MRAYQVRARAFAPRDGVVQDELRELRGLAAARLSGDDGDLIVGDGGEKLFRLRPRREPSTLRHQLAKRRVRGVGDARLESGAHALGLGGDTSVVRRALFGFDDFRRGARRARRGVLSLRLRTFRLRCRSQDSLLLRERASTFRRRRALRRGGRVRGGPSLISGRIRRRILRRIDPLFPRAFLPRRLRRRKRRRGSLERRPRRSTRGFPGVDFHELLPPRCGARLLRVRGFRLELEFRKRARQVSARRHPSVSVRPSDGRAHRLARLLHRVCDVVPFAPLEQRLEERLSHHLRRRAVHRRVHRRDLRELERRVRETHLGDLERVRVPAVQAHVELGQVLLRP